MGPQARRSGSEAGEGRTEQRVLCAARGHLSLSTLTLSFPSSHQTVFPGFEPFSPPFPPCPPLTFLHAFPDDRHALASALGQPKALGRCPPRLARPRRGPGWGSERSDELVCVSASLIGRAARWLVRAGVRLLLCAEVVVPWPEGEPNGGISQSCEHRRASSTNRLKDNADSCLTLVPLTIRATILLAFSRVATYYDFHFGLDSGGALLGPPPRRHGYAECPSCLAVNVCN